MAWKAKLSQRRALHLITSPEDILVQRSLYLQARSEIDPKWQWLRLLASMGMLVGWIILSVFTQFKGHLAQWIMTGVFPWPYAWEMALYVVAFLSICGFFLWAIRWIDGKAEAQIDARYIALYTAHKAKP